MSAHATPNRGLAWVAAAGALVPWSVPALAQASEGPHDQVVIGDSEGGEVSGRLAVNIAAGNGNQQIGAASVAVGDVATTVDSVQQSIVGIDPSDRATRIAIDGNAFSNNSGLISINVTAGLQNQSANLASLAVGNSGALTDQMLAQSRAPLNPTGVSGGGAGASNDSVDISDDAFGESSGLIQVNLIGGERNSSANTFALNVSAGS
jgi:hypothetical protein